jgi:hypothetical protein
MPIYLRITVDGIPKEISTADNAILLVGMRMLIAGYDFARRKKACNFLCGRFIIVNCRTKRK